MVKEGTKELRLARAPLEKRAKEMRHEPVEAEKLFWSFVRNRKLGGFKFKRQVPIGPYIADFVCLDRHLIVELDGPLHAGREGYDAARNAYLRRQGFQVLRFTNEDFLGDTAIILHTIAHALRPPSP